MWSDWRREALIDVTYFFNYVTLIESWFVWTRARAKKTREQFAEMQLNSAMHVSPQINLTNLKL